LWITMHQSWTSFKVNLLYKLILNVVPTFIFVDIFSNYGFFIECSLLSVLAQNRKIHVYIMPLLYACRQCNTFNIGTYCEWPLSVREQWLHGTFVNSNMKRSSIILTMKHIIAILLILYQMSIHQCMSNDWHQDLTIAQISTLYLVLVIVLDMDLTQ